jgi:hypothetical protein
MITLVNGWPSSYPLSKASFGLYLSRNERVNMGWAVASRAWADKLAEFRSATSPPTAGWARRRRHPQTAKKKAVAIKKNAKHRTRRENFFRSRNDLFRSLHFALFLLRVYSLLLCFSSSSVPSPIPCPRFAAISVAVHGLRRRGRPGRPAPAAARCGGLGVLGRRALRVHQQRERFLPVQPQRAAREGGAGAVRVGQREHLPPA